MLASISNQDKHEVIQSSVLIPGTLHANYYPHVVDFEWLYALRSALQSGARVYRFRTSQPDMPMPEVGIALEVAFGSLPSGPWYLLPILEAFGNQVRAIVGRFRTITPEFQPVQISRQA
jgi:hypothetical protein